MRHKQDFDLRIGCVNQHTLIHFFHIGHHISLCSAALIQLESLFSPTVIYEGGNVKNVWHWWCRSGEIYYRACNLIGWLEKIKYIIKNNTSCKHMQKKYTRLCNVNCKSIIICSIKQKQIIWNDEHAITQHLKMFEFINANKLLSLYLVLYI